MTRPFAHIQLATCAHPDCDRLPNGAHGHCCVRCLDYHDQSTKPAHTDACDLRQTADNPRVVQG